MRTRLTQVPVDVMIVSLGTTLGLQATDSKLSETLERMGLKVALTTAILSQPRTLRRWAYRSPLLDIREAYCMRRAVQKRLRLVQPQVFIYTTTTAGLLQPLKQRRQSMLRFDALARENRLGRANGILRLLEKLTLQRSIVLLPLSGAERYSDLQAVSELPPAVRILTRQEKVDPDLVLSYVSTEKKRLDFLLSAWRIADGRMPGRFLAIAGLTMREAENILPTGFHIPANVNFLGPLPPLAYRTWSQRASVYLASARYEDFGLAPMEALADGSLLVTSPSAGPFPALAFARGTNPSLVATDMSANTLAQALMAAWCATEKEIREYREAASAFVDEYSEAAFDKRIQSLIVNWCPKLTYK